MGEKLGLDLAPELGILRLEPQLRGRHQSGPRQRSGRISTGKLHSFSVGILREGSQKRLKPPRHVKKEHLKCGSKVWGGFPAVAAVHRSRKVGFGYRDRFLDTRGRFLDTTVPFLIFGISWETWLFSYCSNFLFSSVGVGQHLTPTMFVR